MRNSALSLASKVIYSHMYDKEFIYQNKSSFKFALLSKNFDLLHGEKFEKIDMSKEFQIKNDVLYIVDRSVQSHLGIEYIVVRNDMFYSNIENFLYKVLFITILAIIFTILIGYVLGEFFLSPIANERKRIDSFIQDITHELNTPITALLICVNQLKNKELEVSKKIEISSQRIFNIYEDLRCVMQNNLNQKKIVENINFRTVVMEQKEIFESFAKTKHIRIDTDVEDLKFRIHKEDANKIIVNLLSNAIKYSKPYTTIIIKIKDKTIMVKDQGLGMDTMKLEYYKQRYSQERKDSIGYGIGLDIVNKICMQYNISFDMKSKLGNGSTILLYLP